MNLVTCVTIQSETATSPFFIPTATLNLKSPPSLCRAHGEYPLQVKPGKLSPPSPPQLQPPLCHPPSLRDVGTHAPCHVISSTTDHDNDSGMGVSMTRLPHNDEGATWTTT